MNINIFYFKAYSAIFTLLLVYQLVLFHLLQFFNNITHNPSAVNDSLAWTVSSTTNAKIKVVYVRLVFYRTVPLNTKINPKQKKNKNIGIPHTKVTSLPKRKHMSLNRK